MKRTTFWIAFVLLCVLHHDWWYWDDGTLLLGFLPVGLAYHAGVSLAAAALWAWAVSDVYAFIFQAEPEELTGPAAASAQQEH
jgi:hypothetical protein